MAAQSVSRKRKSTDGTTSIAKKVKMAKSAQKPPPSKSALKKPTVERSEKLVVTKPSKKEDASTKFVQEEVRVSNGGDTEEMEQITVDDNENGGATLTSDQTAALLAGFSSSEDEGDSEDEAGIAISSLPNPPTAGAIQKRIKQAISEQSDPETTPGVIYIGRIPHGFFEPQMKAYFQQFGDILNLRLARNKNTGASQHHAFIEFASAAVADIVAKTMDKYLLFGHILQVRRVPREAVSERLFAGGGRRKKPAPMNRLEGRKLRQGATRDVWERRVEMENQRRAKKAEKLREMGYDFDMPRVKGVSEVPVKETVVEAIETGADGGADVGGGVTPLHIDSSPSVNGVETVKTVPNNADNSAVEKDTTSRKPPASGKAQTKKSVKKVRN